MTELLVGPMPPGTARKVAHWKARAPRVKQTLTTAECAEKDECDEFKVQTSGALLIFTRQTSYVGEAWFTCLVIQHTPAMFAPCTLTRFISRRAGTFVFGNLTD